MLSVLTTAKQKNFKNKLKFLKVVLQENRGINQVRERHIKNLRKSEPIQEMEENKIKVDISL